ncbi:MAG: hypothetical protein IIA54_08130 [Chloroflexi bacterium]|nr:hypothetical protein [Chloroflexota bacterium]
MTKKKPERKRKPISIDELEALLEREQDTAVEILPNGEIVVAGEYTNKQRGGRMPLTYRENLGGEYSPARAA